MHRASQSLLADLRAALRSELGALATYRRLAARPCDPELLRVLSAFHQDEVELVEQARGVILALGGRARRASFRRLAAAHLLVASTRFFGLRFALRVCQEAESTVSRWYRGAAVELARAGALDEARACDQLSRAKSRHATTLNAWTEHLPAS